MAVYITMKEVTLKKRKKRKSSKGNEISESESVDVEVIDDSKKLKIKYQRLSDLDDSQIKGFTPIDEPLTYPIFGFDQKKSIMPQHIQVNPNESQIFCPPPYQSNPVYQYYAPNMYQNYAPTLVATDTDDKKFGNGVFSIYLIYLEILLEQCIEVQIFLNWEMKNLLVWVLQKSVIKKLL
ncbi:hypothetical protein C1645_859922 [Glomus cerebriforme]|uniref:Uncharacterized protein n=1 Tax=Glomus cerebriforme TaxID=658196 RepID=A0A397SEP9_9GLOM|nr:hypothetical protein C1645_859922 [Glomus cerebriforme]